MERVLVTGAATWTGGNLVRRLAKRDDMAVFAVDDRTPGIRSDAEFRRMSLDGLDLARYVLEVDPTMVIHLQSVHRTSEAGRSSSSEDRILGSLGLFGAIERLTSVRSVIVKSDTAIYGASPRNPSFLAETTRPQGKQSRHQRDLAEMERFLGEAREAHPDVVFTTLRFAPIFGPRVGNSISRYLTLPVVPTLLGFDPRLQLIHDRDVVDALEHAIDNPTDGTFNIAADGQIYLSRMLRLGRRIPQPLPGKMFDTALRGMTRFNVPAPDHLKGLMKHGRVTDTTRMHEGFGFTPTHTCRQTVLCGYERIDANHEKT
ncbi:MAG: NAD-dependent epimerase/dehydratase family protein [Actinomycetota bacterium]